MNVRFSIAIVPATLMSFSFWSTRLVRPFKSPLMPSTLTFTLLIVLLIVLLFSAILTSTDLSTLLIIVVLFSLIAFSMFWLITVLLASILVSMFLLITTLFSVILLLIVVSIFWTVLPTWPFKSSIALVLLAILVVFTLTLSSTAVIRVELSTMLSCK